MPLSRRTTSPSSGLSRVTKWLPWLLGAAALGAVITLGLHFSEGQQFLDIAQQAKPWWLVVAALLQSATYVTEGEVWRLIGREAGCRFGVAAAAEISLAKLFVDQALPSGGITGSILMASALERRQVPPPAVKAAVALERTSFHLAYVVALVIAITLGLESGHINRAVLITAGVFITFAVALIIGIVAVAGSAWRPRTPIGRLTPVRRAIEFLRDADGSLVRSPRLIALTTTLQITIIALDTATLLVVLHSIGASLPVSGVFVSFMISSLFRTIGIAPGGVGTFEASAVLTLRMAGATLPVAFAATMLFRGLSFWLPMMPGLYFARRTTKSRAEA